MCLLSFAAFTSGDGLGLHHGGGPVEKPLPNPPRIGTSLGNFGDHPLLAGNTRIVRYCVCSSGEVSGPLERSAMIGSVS